MNLRITLLTLSVLLAGCQAPTKYYWGDYSSTLLDYYQDPKAEAAYEKSLTRIVSAEAKGQKVPPGLYAELGYERLAHGDTNGAIDSFTREKTHWPEAALFMDKAIENARNGKNVGSVTPPSPAPASPVS